MKLKDLAEINAGLTIDANLFKKVRKPDNLYFPVLQASDFSDQQGHYVFQKDLKKIPGYSGKSFLFYGDYIIYKKNDEYKVYRYESTSGQTIASNGLIVITANMGILNDFLSFPENIKYFCNELESIKSDQHENLIHAIGDIEILTDNILELEDANKAEQIGIRKPINLIDLPFRITQKPLPFDKLLKRIAQNELLLDTEFQRRPGLWDIATKSRLIESMIVRLPIPAFYFDGSNDDEWLVIDGLQRLSAVNSFVNEEFELVDLDYLPELEGKSFSSLDRPHQRNIEEYDVIAYIIENGTPKSVTYKIFKSINTSALKLEPQEIRHAINPGAPAILLKAIAEKEWFRKSLTLTNRQRDRMEDRETALRFIAFQRMKYTEFKPTIVDFLDTAMTDIYNIPEIKQQIYIQEMEEIFHLLVSTLGDKAFSRSLFDDTRLYGHNTIIFELLTYGLSTIPKDRRKRIVDPISNFKGEIIRYFNEKPDRFWDTDFAYTIENIRKRFSDIEQLFKFLTK